MKWKFWTSKKSTILTQVQEHLVQISQHLILLDQQVTSNSEQITEIGDLVRKLSRLQYKTGQDVQGKLEGLTTGLNVVQQGQIAYALDASRLDALEQQKAQVTKILLVWLDDLDFLTPRLKDNGQELWQQLLEQWTSQIFQALHILGISEIEMLGTSFNPKIAESIGTVVRPSVVASGPDEKSISPSQPYEVAEVIKRGFISGDGKLLRKAQVITYEDKNKENDHEQR